MTDNLGDWAVIRKRLNDDLERKQNAPLMADGDAMFEPFTPANRSEADAYFVKELAGKVRQAASVGWSPDAPAKVMVNEGKHTWTLTSNYSLDGIMAARHAAPSDDGKSIAPGTDAGAPRAGPFRVGRVARRRRPLRIALAARAFD